MKMVVWAIGLGALPKLDLLCRAFDRREIIGMETHYELREGCNAPAALIGSEIALMFALSGHPTILSDASREIADSAMSAPAISPLARRLASTVCCMPW